MAAAAEAKRRWRRRLRATRAALPTDARRRAERAICAGLLSLARSRLGAGAVVGAYSAVGSEVDPSGFCAAWLAAGGRLAWPRVADRLTFHAVADPAVLAEGYRGIREPPPSAPEVPLSGLALLLLPGLGFDRWGGRLGQGGGFYDRLLAGGAPALKVGLAFAAQIVARVPTDPHDQAMDLVVTELGVARAGRWAPLAGVDRAAPAC